MPKRHLFVCLLSLAIVTNALFGIEPKPDPLNGGLKGANSDSIRMLNPNRNKINAVIHSHQSSYQKAVDLCFKDHYPSNKPVSESDKHNPKELEKCLLQAMEDLSLKTKKTKVSCACEEDKAPIQDSRSTPGDGVDNRYK